MKVVALISGGKDSCYNMLQCVAHGHEIVALANLQPCEDEIDSYMYQSVGHDALDLYAKAMNLPLFRQDIMGKPVNQDFHYIPTDGDEVEDLFTLLHKIKGCMKIEGVSVGAIFSDYQRLRVQNVHPVFVHNHIPIQTILVCLAFKCDRLQLRMLAYLWHRNQEELLQEMINCKIKAIVIKVAALGLDPAKHLGKTLEEIFPHMLEMNKKYGLNICGEGGEFETFTLDCPLFKKQLLVVKQETVIHSNDAFAPVAYLKLKNVELKDKNCDANLTQFDCVQDLPVNLYKPIGTS